MTDNNSLSEESGFNSLSNPQLTALYLEKRRAFREHIKRAQRISRGSAGIVSTHSHMFWASVLFTRICVTGISINKLLPGAEPGEHWDLSAVTSLTRNLAEAYLFYH